MIETSHHEILLTAAYFEAARTQLDNLAAKLRRYSDVSDVYVHFGPREYDSGLLIETYVEAELTDGRALLWWLEMRDGPDYRVEAALVLTDEEGQRTLQTIQEQEVASLPETLRAFAAAAESLALRSDVSAILHSVASAAA